MLLMAASMCRRACSQTRRPSSCARRNVDDAAARGNEMCQRVARAEVGADVDSERASQCSSLILQFQIRTDARVVHQIVHPTDFAHRSTSTSFATSNGRAMSSKVGGYHEQICKAFLRAPVCIHARPARELQCDGFPDALCGPVTTATFPFVPLLHMSDSATLLVARYAESVNAKLLCKRVLL